VPEGSRSERADGEAGPVRRRKARADSARPPSSGMGWVGGCPGETVAENCKAIGYARGPSTVAAGPLAAVDQPGCAAAATPPAAGVRAVPSRVGPLALGGPALLACVYHAG
jgi:hypothetical protein